MTQWSLDWSFCGVCATISYWMFTSKHKKYSVPTVFLFNLPLPFSSSPNPPVQTHYDSWGCFYWFPPVFWQHFLCVFFLTHETQHSGKSKNITMQYILTNFILVLLISQIQYLIYYYSLFLNCCPRDAHNNIKRMSGGQTITFFCLANMFLDFNS